jgi:hypothetical protein
VSLRLLYLIFGQCLGLRLRRWCTGPSLVNGVAS